MLGILGGMGPLAGAQFLLRLTLMTPAQRDQDHIPAVLWSDPTVPDRTEARLRGGEDPLPALLRGLRGLEAAGCRAIAIPCNTAHGWFQAMQGATQLPILHIVDAAAEDLQRQSLGGVRVGVMGTGATLAMGLYQERFGDIGHEVLVPTPAEMAELVTPGIALVKSNRVAEAYPLLAQAAQQLVDRGAGAIVLGCTEIPLGIAAGPTLPFPVVDTIDALARVAIRWSGREPVDLSSPAR